MHAMLPSNKICELSAATLQPYNHIEDQVFLRSYDSAPRPPPFPLSRQQEVALSQSSCVPPAEFTDGIGGREGGGRGA
jgi:hypothetical protein